MWQIDRKANGSLRNKKGFKKAVTKLKKGPHMIQVRRVEFILKSKKIDIELGRQQLPRNSSDDGPYGVYFHF